MDPPVKPAPVSRAEGSDPHTPAALEQLSLDQDTVKKTGASPKTPRRQCFLNTNYFLADGILYRQGKSKNQKFLFTEAEKKRAFWEAHVVEDRHYGSRITCSKLSKKYFWPRVTIDVCKWIKKCRKCQDRKIRMAAHAALETGSGRALQEESRIPLQMKFSGAQEKGLFSFVSLQLFGPLEQTARGAQFAFVAFDYFTKWVHAAPMQTCSPEETVRQVLELVKKFGLPEGIISAQPRGFIFQLNQILKMTLKMQGNLIVKYNPQTDQFLENSQSFVRRLLSLVLTTNPTDWDQHLHKVFFIQNGDSGYEEENLSSLEVQLEAASSANGGDWSPSLCSPEGPPGGERDSPVKVRSNNGYLQCNWLPEERDWNVLAVLECEKYQEWIQDLCVRRQQEQGCGKIQDRTQRARLWAAVGAGPGPEPSCSTLEAGPRGARRMVDPHHALPVSYWHQAVPSSFPPYQAAWRPGQGWAHLLRDERKCTN